MHVANESLTKNVRRESF